jgi:hypothetical protein
VPSNYIQSAKLDIEAKGKPRHTTGAFPFYRSKSVEPVKTGVKPFRMKILPVTLFLDDFSDMPFYKWLQTGDL